MARTITDIKKQITDSFIGSEVIREKYELDPDKTFEEQFSKVSLESILFYIVSAAIWTLETLFDMFKAEVDDKISRAVVASIPWYYKISKEYQHGNDLIFDETTQQYIYPTIDESKQIIRYAAVRDMGSSVSVLVSADQAGRPIKITDDVLRAFKYYLNKRKPAGVVLNINSYSPDIVKIEAEVVINPILLNPNGSLINTPGRYPITEAIETYLNNIIYGGTFNKTRLVDAVQQAEGVIDVVLGNCYARTAATEEFTLIGNNNYTAESGSFKIEDLSISYVVQD